MIKYLEMQYDVQTIGIYAFVKESAWGPGTPEQGRVINVSIERAEQVSLALQMRPEKGFCRIDEVEELAEQAREKGLVPLLEAA